MSSWERARFVPWTRIPQGDVHTFSLEKERIFRQLQREADQQEKELIEASKTSKNDAAVDLKEVSQTTSMLNSQYRFKWIDLFKSAAFGGTIGSITGSVFGFMDGMRTAQQNKKLRSKKHNKILNKKTKEKHIKNIKKKKQYK